MNQKTINNIGIIGLLVALLYLFWKRSSPDEIKNRLENQLADALRREDYKMAARIREKLKRYKN